MSELIVIKQLPVIEEQLKNISEDIDKKVEELNKLEVNEDTVKEVRKVRTQFRKDFDDLENKRKEVKKAVLTPYEQFEEIYKNYVTNKFRKADNDLKNKIDNIESQIKQEKEQEVKRYFEEYRQVNNIDFIEYRQANIKVNLSDSMKSLKKQVKNFIDQRIDDLKLIETQEHKTEILVEYKQSLNVSNAIMMVNNRFKAIEEEKKKQEEFIKEASKAIIVEVKDNPYAIQKQEILQAPVEEREIKQYTLKFTVKATKTKLVELKKFLNDGGYIYE